MKQIDLSSNTALKALDLGYNQLTQVDLSNNIALINLGLSHNQLIKIDLSNNKALQLLHLWNNSLTEIDLSNNTALKDLRLNGNQITCLDLSSNTNLSDITISPQLSENLAFTKSGSSYQVDMTRYVTELNRVSNIKCYDYDGKKLDCEYNNSTGMITFENPPARVEYSYSVNDNADSKLDNYKNNT